MSADHPVVASAALPSYDDASCCSTTPAAAVRLSSPRRDALRRRVRLLVAATISYNVVEGIVAISAGTIANSTALVGFGLDSIIEGHLRRGCGPAVLRS